jgi:Ca-activated chloride channel family protein
MSFLWPQMLWLLLALPACVALYVWLLRRRKSAVTFASLGLVREALGRGPRIRRHVPPALLLLAMAAALVAVARPTAVVTLPSQFQTIVLAIDVSLSMRVTDVQPTRMVAAQAAAKSYLQDLPRDIDVGLVTFAGTAQVAQQITRDRPSLVGAIDGIQMQRGTAIGSAIVVCLTELFPDHGIDLSDMLFGSQRPAQSLDRQAKTPPKTFEPVAPGSYKPAAIILLSDGRRTMGVDTLQAAKMAADRGVRIYVVGLGTPDGHASMGEGMAIYLQLDEPTLRQVAEMTGGEYHHAATAEALRSVYQNLGTRLQLHKRETELSGLLALAAAAFLLAGAGLSVAWFGRVA